MDVETNGEAMISGLDQLLAGIKVIPNTGGGARRLLSLGVVRAASTLKARARAAGARNGKKEEQERLSKFKSDMGFSAGLPVEMKRADKRLRVDVNGRRMESRYDFG